MTVTTHTEHSDHPHVHGDDCRHLAIPRAIHSGNWDNDHAS